MEVCEQVEFIQMFALGTITCLLGTQFHQRAAANQLVRALEGTGRGIHAVFRALKNFPTETNIVWPGFHVLCDLDLYAHAELMNYTHAHPNWRAILANTDAALCPEIQLFGTPMRDF